MSLSVPLCAACHHACFPPRLLCPRCGGDAWHAKEVTGGEVLAATTVAHRPDAATRAPVHLASVRIEGGVIIITRVAHPVSAGEVLAV
jgi:uncharacterized OB-fold protein